MTKLLLIGTGLVIAGFIWRALVARSRRDHVTAALISDDGSVRATALRRISRAGLAPFADQLLALASGLTDPVRKGEIAWLIASTQWEPARDPRVAQLRLWADDQYRRREAQSVQPGTREPRPAPAAPERRVARSAAPGFSPPGDLGLPTPQTGQPSSTPPDGTSHTLPPAPLREAIPQRPAPSRLRIPMPNGSAADAEAAHNPSPATADAASNTTAGPATVSAPLPARHGRGTPGPDGAGGQADICQQEGTPPLVEAIEEILGDAVLWLEYEPAVPSGVLVSPNLP